MLALAAADAGRGGAIVLDQVEVGLLGAPGVAVLVDQVIEGKVFGDGNVHGAAGGVVDAVAAAGALDGKGCLDDLHTLFDNGHFLFVEGPEVDHIGGVVDHLLHGAHTAEDHGDILMGGCKADSPAGRGSIGGIGLEHIVQFFGNLGQRAALDGLHDPDLLAVLDADVIVGLGLDEGIVPVGIVELQLDELHFGVLPEDLFQQDGIVVVGEADVLDQTLGLAGNNEVEAAVLGDVDVVAGQIVEEVIVKVAGAGLFQLLGKNTGIVCGGLDRCDRHLVGQQEGLSGMALDQTFTDSHLAGVVVIHIGGIDIGEALFEEVVKHLLDLLEVDISLFAAGDEGQAHGAKTEFFHGILSLYVMVYYFADTIIHHGGKTGKWTVEKGMRPMSLPPGEALGSSASI